MTRTNTDVQLRDDIIRWIKELSRLKLSDKEIIYGVIGKLGASERVVRAHFNGWKAQKRLIAVNRSTLKEKIERIIKDG